jgi:hypothetical protein
MEELIFNKKTKAEIKKVLEEKGMDTVQSTLNTLEELAREQGSTTGNLEDYSFSIEIEKNEKKMTIKKTKVVK